MHQQNSLPEGATLHISAAGCSDTGRVRKHNEDAIVLCEPPDLAKLSELGRLYLLADGAGGHAAGEIASRMAVETISTVYYDQADFSESVEDVLQSQGEVTHLAGPSGDLEIPLVSLLRGFATTHRRIRELAALKPAYFGMATTCLAAVMKGTRLLIAHVGDSRAYLIHGSAEPQPVVTHLTSDHSMAVELMRAGIISAEQVQRTSHRHVLTRALGGREERSPRPDITTCLVQPGDSLVLCCDGLWSMLTEEQIAMAVRRNPPQQACDELIRLANEAGGEDNISAIILSFM
jgi:serine/threonine protein phosphatase PrpC